MSPVLDASVVLAMLWGEPSRVSLLDLARNGCVSTVNYAEVVTKLFDRGFADEGVQAQLEFLRVDLVPFTAAQAAVCGALRPATRHLGLSLGDRCCLALALERGARVMTADRSWAGLDVGVEIQVIR